PAPAWPMVLAFSTSPTTTESISLSLHDALPISGHMRIATDNGSVYFAVEEYKRPKFEVAFDTVKANIALNEEITIRGRATAYAGNNIDGAEVKYRVVRHARFPYFWAFFRWGQPQSPQREIANGTVQTQPDGTI